MVKLEEAKYKYSQLDTSRLRDDIREKTEKSRKLDKELKELSKKLDETRDEIKTF